MDKITDSTPLMKYSTRMPADSGKMNASATCTNPDSNRYTPNNVDAI